MKNNQDKFTQLRNLERVLDDESRLPSNCKAVFDDDVIQSEYETCIAFIDMERAKKLYAITKVKPSDEMMLTPVKTSIRAVLPITMDYTANKACSPDSGFIDQLLKEYRPCLDMPICASGAPGLFAQEKSKPVTDATELCYLMIQKTKNLEQGTRYTWEIPILQEVNIIGQPLSFPYLNTKVEPKITKLI
jgi:hypothetical protein